VFEGRPNVGIRSYLYIIMYIIYHNILSSLRSTLIYIIDLYKIIYVFFMFPRKCLVPCSLPILNGYTHPCYTHESRRIGVYNIITVVTKNREQKKFISKTHRTQYALHCIISKTIPHDRYPYYCYTITII